VEPKNGCQSREIKNSKHLPLSITTTHYHHEPQLMLDPLLSHYVLCKATGTKNITLQRRDAKSKCQFGGNTTK
jgi:hypothetical protein